MKYSEEELKAIYELKCAIDTKKESEDYEDKEDLPILETLLNLIEKQQKKIEDYETIEKIEVDNENRLSEEEVLISTMEYYIETNQVMTVPEQENQLIAVKYILNKKNKQINNSVSKDKIREKMQEYYEKASPYDYDTADYKQSQEIGGFNALRKLLEE